MVVMNNYPAGISLCMIVKDEERFLDDALRSLADVVDEICIVDTGSRDRTLEIARAPGARVERIPWQDDFGRARNAALSMATKRWIVVLDADERLDAHWRTALKAIGRTPAGLRGKWIACRNLTVEHNVGGTLTNALVRIFPNDPRIRYRNAIHEFVTLDGSDGGLPADKTPIEIVHLGYLPEIVVERKKGERNVRLARAAAERDPSDAFNQYNLGMASRLAGDPSAALTALDCMRELTQGAPRGFRVHGLVTLAELYAQVRGDLNTALALVRECLALVPTYANAHFAHGKLLAQSGELFEAREAFGRAIAAGVHDGEHFIVDVEIALWKGYSEIGSTLMREARFAEALAWFELASAVRATAQPLLINRAKCYEALGDLDAAGTLFAAALADDAAATGAIEWINFLLRRGRLDDACAAVEDALPDVGAECRVVLLGTVAAAQLRAGRPDRARAAIERAVTCGDAALARATLAALGTHLGVAGFVDLLAAPVPLRANRLHIAYATSR